MHVQIGTQMAIDMPPEFLHLYKVVDADAIRYAGMAGVLVKCDPQGVCKAVATDGRMIAEVQWKQDGDDFIAGQTIIPRKICREVATADKYDNKLLLRLRCASLSLGDKTLDFEPIEGRFPDTDAIFSDCPEMKLGVRTFQPRLMRTLMDIASRIGEIDNRQGCDFVFSGDQDHCAFMKMRLDGSLLRFALMPIAT